MKKKYFTPELEELRIDNPVVLDVVETSGGSGNTHEEEGGESL